MREALIEELKREVILFRNAILDVKSEGNLPSNMHLFPRGCCGDTSILLSSYLKQRGYEDVNYICGKTGNKDSGTWKTHAWITVNGIIVDITRSQFGKEDITVSAESVWHDNWEQQIVDVPNVAVTGDQLSETYEYIVNKL